MFPMIGITLWSKYTGGIEAISEPGRYILHCTLSFTVVNFFGLIGHSISIAGWTVTVVDVRADADSGCNISIDVGPTPEAQPREPGDVNAAKLSPLQISGLIGTGLLLGAALFVDRISKASPILSLLIYGAIALVLVYVYRKYLK